jgi:hypothetical protein
MGAPVNRDQFTAVWRALDAAFPGTRDTDTKTVYANQLADMSPDLFAAAADWCISNEEFFPTVAKIRSSQRLVAKSAVFRETPALPAATDVAPSERQRQGRYGKAMSDAVLAGFGAEWKSAAGVWGHVADARPGEMVFAFDWHRDEVLLDGVSVTLADVIELVADEAAPVAFGGTAARGHDHRKGAGGCKVCSLSWIRWAS